MRAIGKERAMPTERQSSSPKSPLRRSPTDASEETRRRWQQRERNAAHFLTIWDDLHQRHPGKFVVIWGDRQVLIGDDPLALREQLPEAERRNAFRSYIRRAGEIWEL